MAKIKIQGNASGSGVILLTAPNTSTDRTITLPDASVTLGAATPSITDNGNANAITIDSAENVGIGVVPEAWNAALTGLQIGETGAISGGNTAWGGFLEIGSNFYRNSAGFKYTTADKACLTEYDNANGNINFKTAPSGNADAALTLTSRLQILNDGRGVSQFTANAWVNFAQDTTIRDSHNVSSITDNAVGNHTVNFANNMANANYCTQVTSAEYAGTGQANQIGTLHRNSTYTTSAVKVAGTHTASGDYVDNNMTNVLVFGD